MLKVLAIAAAIAIVAGITLQYVQAAPQFKPDAMYHAKVHQHLYKAGVSFVHKQFDDHIIILPSHKTGLVVGYDKPVDVCAALRHIRKVKKITIYTDSGKKSASCE